MLFAFVDLAGLQRIAELLLLGDELVHLDQDVLI